MHKHIRKKIEHALEFTFVAEKSEIKHIPKTSIICLRMRGLKGNVSFFTSNSSQLRGYFWVLDDKEPINPNDANLKSENWD